LHLPTAVLGCVIDLLSLPFTMSLYLASKGEWLDLTNGNPGVWVWGTKLQFQEYLGTAE
jgi:hypothetical protein